MNFGALKTITDIEGVLVNETPIHIGKGAGGLGEVDLPVEKDINNRPYIPGSSIKGSLRFLSEILAKTGNYKVCDPLNPKNLCSIATKAMKKIIDLSTKGISLDRIKDDVVELFKQEDYPSIAEDIKGRAFTDINSLINYILDNYGPCIICRIFGNTELASHIIFFDSYPVKDITPINRTRVAIDRFRAASRAGALFTYEYIPRGCEWHFKVRIINIDLIEDSTPEVKLLRAVIKYLCQHGFQIGGMKTIGLGFLKLNPEKTSVKRCVIENLEIKCITYDLVKVINEW